MGNEILVIEDNPDTLDLLKDFLSTYPVEVMTASKASEGFNIVQAKRPAVILLDYRLPDEDGLSLLPRILSESPRSQVVLMSAYASVPLAVEAVRLGALDVLQKPAGADQLDMVLQRALRVAALMARDLESREEIERRFMVPNIVGESPALVNALRLAGEVAATEATVLITGATGTGKELFARAIHFNSPRKMKSFFPINCSAIPDTLLESELFGYRKGAFTGADGDRLGILATANGGTVFLDEIAETSPAFQAKLLRVLEEKQYLPLGATELKRCDVRIVAATNKPLEEWVAEGKFREDLYYRINGFEIHLPPLSQRRGDMAILADHFLKKIAASHGLAKVPVLGKGVLEALAAYPWPGNIREFRNKLQMACILSKGGTIGPRDIFPREELRQRALLSSEWILPPDGVEWAGLEKTLLTQALERSGQNTSKAAKLLGMSRATLRYRMKKFGIGEVRPT